MNIFGVNLTRIGPLFKYLWSEVMNLEIPTSGMQSCVVYQKFTDIRKERTALPV